MLENLYRELPFPFREPNMVRTKVRWVLFELLEDPIIQHDKVVFPRTPLNITERTILNNVWLSITANYGDFGNGMSRGIVGESCISKG